MAGAARVGVEGGEQILLTLPGEAREGGLAAAIAVPTMATYTALRHHITDTGRGVQLLLRRRVVRRGI